MKQVRLALIAAAAGIVFDAVRPMHAAEPPATAPTTAPSTSAASVEALVRLLTAASPTTAQTQAQAAALAALRARGRAAAPATAPASTRPTAVPTTMPAFVYGTLALPDGVTPMAQAIVSARVTDDRAADRVGIARTEDDGSFVLNRALQPGRYELTVMADSSSYPLTSITVAADTGPLALRLVLPGGSLSGHVSTAAALPAADTLVSASDRAGGHRYYGKTDAQGDYQLKYVLPGTYDVHTFVRTPPNGKDFQSAEVKGVEVTDEAVEVDLAAKPPKRRIMPTKPPETTVD